MHKERARIMGELGGLAQRIGWAKEAQDAETLAKLQTDYARVSQRLAAFDQEHPEVLRQLDEVGPPETVVHNTFGLCSQGESWTWAQSQGHPMTNGNWGRPDPDGAYTNDPNKVTCPHCRKIAPPRRSSQVATGN